MLTLEKLNNIMEMLEKKECDNFYIVVHPDNFYRLKVMQARDKYYLENHIRRLEKWHGR
jgi:hypothetical protein